MSFLAWIDVDQADRDRTRRISDLFLYERIESKTLSSVTNEGRCEVYVPITHVTDYWNQARNTFGTAPFLIEICVRRFSRAFGGGLVLSAEKITDHRKWRRISIENGRQDDNNC